MGIVFAVRGDSFAARYSTGGKTGINFSGGYSVAADAGALSGSTILAAANNNAKILSWPARRNTPNGRSISVLVRLKTGYAGAPASSRPLFPILYSACARFMKIAVTHTVTSGNVTCVTSNESAGGGVNGSAGAWSPASGSTFYDVVYTWDGTTTANAFKVYIDGVSLGNLTASAAFSASITNEWFQAIELGDGFQGIYQNATAYDEIVIWDTVIDPTSVALVSGTGSLNGASRTSLVDVASSDGSSYTDPGVANVKTGTAYTYAGASQTGTYDGSDRWTDPGESVVVSGVAYKANSTTNNKTGTFTTPTAAQIATEVWGSSKALTIAKFLGLK
jgi:hypothetical protein